MWVWIAARGPNTGSELQIKVHRWFSSELHGKHNQQVERRCGSDEAPYLAVINQKQKLSSMNQWMNEFSSLLGVLSVILAALPLAASGSRYKKVWFFWFMQRESNCPEARGTPPTPAEAGLAGCPGVERPNETSEMNRCYPEDKMRNASTVYGETGRSVNERRPVRLTPPECLSWSWRLPWRWVTLQSVFIILYMYIYGAELHWLSRDDVGCREWRISPAAYMVKNKMVINDFIVS